MSKLTLVCTAWRPWRKNTLLGFATITVVEMRLSIKDVAVHQKGESRWAALPARPQIRDDSVVRDAAGKAQYVSLLEFESSAVREAFSRAVIRALLEFAPRALEETEGVS